MPVTRSRARFPNEERKSSSESESSFSATKLGLHIDTEATTYNFAPNVTPITFKTESEIAEEQEAMLANEVVAPQSALFPPAAAPSRAPARRRAPGKRLSEGYVPRPPNAFMLFRANFVKQGHISSGVEVNHGSVSKIIGSCWKSLPPDEKRIWEKQALEKKAEHKRTFPDYRFRPVHKKKKDKVASARSSPSRSASSSSFSVAASPTGHLSRGLFSGLSATSEKAELRRDFITKCLLNGYKAEALTAEVKNWDASNGWVDGDMPVDGPPSGAARPEVTPSPIAMPTLPVLPSLSSPPSLSSTASSSRVPSRRSSSVPLSNDSYPSFFVQSDMDAFSARERLGLQNAESYFSTYNDVTSEYGAQYSLHDAYPQQMRVPEMAPPSLPSIHQLLPGLPSVASPSPLPANGSFGSAYRYLLGGRRASSAQPLIPSASGGSSTLYPHLPGPGAYTQSVYGEHMHTSASLEGDEEELPQADTSLFQSGFTFGASSMEPKPQSNQVSDQEHQNDSRGFEGYSAHRPAHQSYNGVSDELSHRPTGRLSLDFLKPYAFPAHLDPLDVSPLSETSSLPSSRALTAYSGSPAPSDRDEMRTPAPQQAHHSHLMELDTLGPQAPFAVDGSDASVAVERSFDSSACGNEGLFAQPDAVASQFSIPSFSEARPTGPSEGRMIETLTPKAVSEVSPIDSATAFTDLWKGLASSRSFAIAMGVPSHGDSTNSTFSNVSPSLDVSTAQDTHRSLDGIDGIQDEDEFDRALRTHHAQLTREYNF